ncbi:MAG: cytochrome c biogenesis protein CcdA [Methanolinea sp.]|nr:cytochrome c biogenesis protein CcdA [Methanolinea sp.]
MDALSAWTMAFLAGTSAPLASPCMLPLYPGFLSYLASKGGGGSRGVPVPLLGAAVAAGVIASLLSFGAAYTLVLRVPLSRIVPVLSPVAFGLLAVFSVLLVLDADLSRWTGGIPIPRVGLPVPDAFLLGLFLGIVILPCNAAAVVALLAIGTTLGDLLLNTVSFLSFGAGMSLPLLAFAALPPPVTVGIVGWLARHRRAVRAAAGVLMLGIAVYSLLGLAGVPAA